MVHFQSWIFVAAMKQKYKQAVSELSHTQESQIVTTPTQPQLNLSLGWHQNSDSLTRIDWYQPRFVFFLKNWITHAKIGSVLGLYLNQK